MPTAMIAQMGAKIKDGQIDSKELDDMLYGKEGEADDTIVSPVKGE